MLAGSRSEFPRATREPPVRADDAIIVEVESGQLGGHRRFDLPPGAEAWAPLEPLELGREGGVMVGPSPGNP
jgi:hypothetical protein